MQSYLFAANLFTLTAFLLGLNNFSRGSQDWRLLPLFLLVVSQSLSLMTSMAETTPVIIALLAGLSIFGAGCLVWALTDTARLPPLWQRLAWLGGAAALSLALLPLIPNWPVPFQIHSLIITMTGAFFILASLPQFSWSHLAAPVLLAVANLLSLLGLMTVAWLVTLLSYGFLIAALHWESMQHHRRREQLSEEAARQAFNLSQERQRLLEVSEIISAVPGLEQSMTHLVRSMAHVTHADQAAIFSLDVEVEERARLIAIYSPERPVYLSSYNEITFDLANCPPLQIALVTQKQQLFVPFRNLADLESLYELWNEYRAGPALVQPLIVQGRSIGALVLGNPVTHQSFREDDLVLCRSLAAQMATMVEAYRRYIDLELQAEQKPEAAIELAAGPSREHYAGADLERPTAWPRRSDQPEENATEVALAILEGAEPAGLDAVISTKILSTTGLNLANGAAADYLPVLDTIEEGLVISNGRGQVQLVNKAAERILGKTQQELVGQPIGMVYGAIHSPDKIEDLAVAFARRNEPLPTFIENDDRTIQGQLIPWRNEDKEWLGMIAIFKDVTQTVKADQARNNFIMALSRVLRGPLTLIRGYAELTTTGLLEEYSPEQLHVQKIIHSSVERVVEILDNAIQVNSQNKIVPRFELIDVNKVIDQALHEITPLAQLREVRLIREVKGALPLIAADRVHLFRILKNLLSNGCRFTPPGGWVALRAWVQQERFGNVSRPQLVLAVADNGVGISKNELKRIFDPFYQLDNLPPGEERGMGMGLAVVKELVEIQRGRVWVESTLGEGTIFYVSLPAGQN
jgi:PAS domain S-box-containing protein